MTSKNRLKCFRFLQFSYPFSCASWSPKGKQIVAGFSNGKIAQYKPDLKLARTIPCTVRLYQTAWDVIAVQWLSTYQFAAVMLPKEENAYPGWWKYLLGGEFLWEFWNFCECWNFGKFENLVGIFVNFCENFGIWLLFVNFEFFCEFQDILWIHSKIIVSENHTKLSLTIAALFIVYAPKNGIATYTNYSDVCYSQSGPRSAQIILTHILPWNLLLVISANGTEVGVLGTTDTGDNPLWKQYLMLDEARAELPLTTNHKETFPLGIDVDTGPTHHLVIEENQLPVMAMLHILSTHGQLISFNILNMTANCPNISSPPHLVPDSSGLNSFTIALPSTNVSTVSPPKADISFSYPAAVTSTPRVPQKTISLSNANEAPKAVSAPFQNTAAAEPGKAFANLFGGQTTIQPIASSQSAFSSVPKSTEALAQPSSQTSVFGIAQASKAQIPASVVTAPLKPNSMHPAATVPVPRPDNNKPFITVAPTFSQPPQSNVIEKATRYARYLTRRKFPVNSLQSNF